MVLNLRNQGTGAWLWARSTALVVLVLLLAVLVGALVLCAVRGGRSLILALGVVLFPFLVALSPATWFWQDGRYDNFFVPMVTIVVVVGCAEASRRLAGSWRSERRAVSLGAFWPAASLPSSSRPASSTSPAS